MSARHTLLIPLVGPMQSWGYRSRFDDRDTGPEPTRSGVIGLLCSALGWGRDTDLAPFAPLRMGVRIDAPGRAMRDYHTAQNVLRAGGGLANTVLSTRHYLADARFLVGLEGNDRDFLAQLETALRAPVWTLWLGRKSFPLSEPPYLPGGSIYSGELMEAFASVSWQAPLGWPNDSPQTLRCAIEDNVAGTLVLSDAPLRFADRTFGIRRVHHKQLPTSKLRRCGKEEALCIFRD
jgi:CRISPR system Cascade subunit CasD